jgi:hypothetical protein
MKIGIPAALLAAAAALLMFGLAIEEEVPIVAALMAAGASLVSYVVVLRGRLGGVEAGSVTEKRLSELEARLSLTEGELDAANVQIQRLRMERDFDRELEAGRAGVGAKAFARPE